MINSSQGIGMTSQRARDRLVEQLRLQGINNEQVLDVIANTPRHWFIDEALASRAYENNALPIGHSQTISQPYIVALMTSVLLKYAKPNKILEIGTGCGYQTAILAKLVAEVCSIERIAPLLAKARKVLRKLSIQNVLMKHGDGYEGWPSQAPFDGILITAAPPMIPEKLLEQLTIGGQMIVPVGPSGEQKLLRIERTKTDFEQFELCDVSFVPLVKNTMEG